MYIYIYIYIYNAHFLKINVNILREVIYKMLSREYLLQHRSNRRDTITA
jgi:hypothetical protein